MVRPLVCVNGIVMNEGKILLIKRNKEPFKGMWSLIGGKVEEEMPDDAILREIKEETGLDCKIRKLSGTFYEKIIMDETKYYFLFIYLLDAPSQDVAFCDEGELKWFDSLPENIAPADKYMIENRDVFSFKKFITKVKDGKIISSEVEDLTNY